MRFHPHPRDAGASGKQQLSCEWENFTVTCTDWGDMKMKTEVDHCGQIPEQLHSSVLRATATCLRNEERYSVLTPNHHIPREHRTPSAKQEEKRKRKKERTLPPLTLLQKKPNSQALPN